MAVGKAGVLGRLMEEFDYGECGSEDEDGGFGAALYETRHLTARDQVGHYNRS